MTPAAFGLPGGAMAHSATVVISSLNEGTSLLRTVRTCLETTRTACVEILVADDHSEDNSVDEMRRACPEVAVVAHDRRRGVSPTKHLGGSRASGDVLVFLDGHCKPEPGAIDRLIDDVARLDGRAIVTPAGCALDTAAWDNRQQQVGHGYRLELSDFSCGWMGTDAMRPRGAFYESPALIGCCLAISRELYAELRGFDAGMKEWGVEDLDFGLKAWLMGSMVLNDPAALVGHRFRRTFDNYTVGAVHPLANQLRMARKHFTESVWLQWLEARQRHYQAWPDVWTGASDALAQETESLERERAYLLAHRMRDEYWYAEYFNLRWPRAG